MRDNPYKAPESKLETAIDESDAHFYVVSIKKFTILFFVTLGMYLVYWFYKNWREYKTYRQSNIWPVPRTIFSIFFTHSLFSEVQNSLKNSNRSFDWNPNFLATTYVIFEIISHILDNLSLKEIGSPTTDLLSILVLPLLYLPLLRAQKAINFSQGDPNGNANNSFTGANYAWIVVGILCWLLVLLGFMDIFGLISLEEG